MAAKTRSKTVGTKGVRLSLGPKPKQKKRKPAVKKPKPPAVKKPRKPCPKRAGSCRDVGRKLYKGPQRIVKRREAVKPHAVGPDGKMKFKAIPPGMTSKAASILSAYRWGYTPSQARAANSKALSTKRVRGKKRR